ncbi:type VI secretion system protein TssL, short form [Jinshanibacter sp. LJY008]|uniref:Type VI secretion system protein TssL, short form n=1 Tax=Limnobaculum eriocheiris TaxID=2897391 RepID=A0A9X1SLY4_9GAMM|nr:type VI secretion system protein TssL, short form [Limnobaculum eriocheiris]MCD1127325.1 type VI secretion system protein TssL, short form [Limnobaculum eriocheiris]
MSQNLKTISIDELLRDTALTVVHLRAGSVVEQGEALYKRCVEQIEQLRKRLTDMQCSTDVVNDISYAACALLDETVLLRNSDEGYNVWQGTPLQVTFFKTYRAGDELFERIRQRIGHPEGALLVLACYDRILGLGFQGRYLAQPQTEREQLVMAVRDLLPKSSTGNNAPTINAVQGKGGFWRRSSLLFWTGISVMAVILLYMLLRQHLDSTLVQLLQDA